MRPTAPIIAVVGGLLCLSVVSGCRVGGYSKPERENDTLRARVKDLGEQLALARAERDELRVKLRHTIEGTSGAEAAEIAAATPRIVALEIDPFSGYVPADVKQAATGVVAYVRTLDGRRRFMQGVGTLTIEVWSGSAASGTGGEPLSRITLTPLQLREAYRSSLMGTHYAVELLLPGPMARGAGTLDAHVLRATYTDAITGETVRGEHALSASAPTTPPSKGKRSI